MMQTDIILLHLIAFICIPVRQMRQRRYGKQQICILQTVHWIRSNLKTINCTTVSMIMENIFPIKLRQKRMVPYETDRDCYL